MAPSQRHLERGFPLELPPPRPLEFLPRGGREKGLLPDSRGGESKLTFLLDVNFAGTDTETAGLLVREAEVDLSLVLRRLREADVLCLERDLTDGPPARVALASRCIYPSYSTRAVASESSKIDVADTCAKRKSLERLGT